MAVESGSERLRGIVNKNPSSVWVEKRDGDQAKRSCSSPKRMRRASSADCFFSTPCPSALFTSCGGQDC